MLFNTLLILLLLVVTALLAYLVFKLRTLQLQLQALQLTQGRSAEQAARNLFAQLEAWAFVRERLDLRQGLPYTRDWSAAPDFLKLIAEHALSAKPKQILECSCGTTSLVLARCCELNGVGTVTSLEHGPEFAQKSRDELARYGLDGIAQVVDAPLEAVTADGRTFQWYRLPVLAERSVEMLVIDGPPGPLQPWSRYPALPLLHTRLADRCSLFLDDAARPDERALVARWIEQLPEWGFSVERVEAVAERGCTILHLRRG